MKACTACPVGATRPGSLMTERRGQGAAGSSGEVIGTYNKGEGDWYYK